MARQLQGVMVPAARHSVDTYKWTIDAAAQSGPVALMCTILERLASRCGHASGAMKFPTKVRTIFLLLLLVLVGLSRLTMASSARNLSFDRAVTSQKVVALTFDADMTPRMSNELKTAKIASWYNQRVIASLREEHVPATLFLAGLWIERYPAVTQDLSTDLKLAITAIRTPPFARLATALAPYKNRTRLPKCKGPMHY